MLRSKFKNDNRTNPYNVIEHVVEQTEMQIEKLTGLKVKLVVEEDDSSFQ